MLACASNKGDKGLELLFVNKQSQRSHNPMRLFAHGESTKNVVVLLRFVVALGRILQTSHEC